MKPIALSLYFFLATHSWLQADPDVAPTPRLKPVPNGMKWIINYQYSTPSPYQNPPPDPAEAYIYQRLKEEHPRCVVSTVTKTGTRRVDISKFDDDSENVTCVIDGLIMVKTRHTNFIRINKISEDTNATIGNDFGSIAWIDTAKYEGHQEYQGKTCDMYLAPAEREMGDKTAYVDAKTGLPVAIVMSNFTITYTFSPATAEAELPEEFVARLKKYRADEALVGKGG